MFAFTFPSLDPVKHATVINYFRDTCAWCFFFFLFLFPPSILFFFFFFLSSLLQPWLWHLFCLPFVLVWKFSLPTDEKYFAYKLLRFGFDWEPIFSECKRNKLRVSVTSRKLYYYFCYRNDYTSKISFCNQNDSSFKLFRCGRFLQN